MNWHDQKHDSQTARQAAEAKILAGPDCLAKRWLLKRIEERTGQRGPQPQIASHGKPQSVESPRGETHQLPLGDHESLSDKEFFASHPPEQDEQHWEQG